MTPTRARARLAAAACLAAVGLGGCITLLPKTPAAQLYRFGGDEASAPSASPPSVQAGPRAGVLLDAATLPRAAGGDGLLTVTGDQAAYIAGARWITPAVLMFSEATQRVFDDRAVRTRLTARGALGRVQASLRLDVRDFQVEYASPGSVPTVAVTLHARLSRPDGTALAEADFAARRPAGEDRVSAIVAAYDAAVADVLARTVAWTDANTPAFVDAPAVPAPPPAASPRRG